MGFLSAKEAAEKWSISQRRVAILCAEDRISGAMRVGNMWVIPEEAQKPDDARATRFSGENNLVVKPFIKWAGGKAQILPEIRACYPTQLGKKITKYAEPFVGGGAVLFDVLSRFDLEEIYISDINSELIKTYTGIRDNLKELLAALRILEQDYLPLDTDRRKEYYYGKRDRFNFLKQNNENDVELASLFIFLNRTCFNGLYRVNSKGGFNVPMGNYKNPTICDEDNLLEVSKKLHGVKIVCGDYKEATEFIDSRTFVYFDPPYRPLSETSSFTAYSQDGFGDREQMELAKYIDDMSAKGAFIVASNSDPKNTDKNDDFFDTLYAKHKIRRIDATRMINSVAEGRGKVSELLIVNY